MNLVVYGTRPEEIKLFPFQAYEDFEFVMVDQSHDLHQDLISPKWKVAEDDFEDFIKYSTTIDIDRVIVQGDTRTAFRAALYAFEAEIPVVHIESGMRTYDLTQPWPEEGYRQMIDRIATYKFCSTQEAQQHLIDEHAEENAYLVGQTSIDTLAEFYSKDVPEEDFYIVTVHRNEAFLLPIVVLLKKMESEGRNLHIYAHPNKIGQELKRHFLTYDPLPYREWVTEMAKCKGFISDSGGLQEEAIFLGKEFISLREKSERGHGETYTTGATAKIVEILK